MPDSTSSTNAELAVTPILNAIRSEAKKRVKNAVDPDLGLDRAHFARRGLDYFRGQLEPDDLNRDAALKAVAGIVSYYALEDAAPPVEMKVLDRRPTDDDEQSPDDVDADLNTELT